ncbi:MAG: hypothetical protein V4618_08855 [Pseudomonadota bacterium]
MGKYLITASAALMLLGSAAWSQSASTHSSTSKVTTANGKVTSGTKVAKTASCKNAKGQFIKCSSVVKTSTTATITKGNDGKCRYAAGPNKGKFTKCP